MAATDTAARDRLQGRRVLVVEDEYFVACDIARALAEAGAEVIGPAPDSSRALALLGEHEAVDGAVLDINLKGEMVYPIADALRARGVPFCFATGYDSAVLPRSYRDVPCWEKPFDLAKLVGAVAEMIAAGRR
jgi:CheY-like chemotaxis protein